MKLSDRLPPYSAESEQAALGACLTDPVACIPECQTSLTIAAFFYDLRHQKIWETIQGLELSRVNLITVHQVLKDDGELESVGGIAYLNECIDACHSTAGLPSWIAEIISKQILRRVIQVCNSASASAFEFQGRSMELLDQIERDILSIRPNQRSETDIKSLMRQAVDIIEKKCTSPDTLSGFETGLIDLDRLTDGIHAGEMIVVAGMPSSGKTALAVNIAVHNSLSQIPCAIFSAEMRPVQLAVRSLCSESRVNFRHVNAQDVPKMFQHVTKISSSPLHIEQANGMSIGQVQAIARRLKQKHAIRIIVVDYIQLLSGTGDNREQVISSVSKGIKAMALELDCAVLALSQLTDDGKLRESRSIGQDADSVWKVENDGEWEPSIQPVKLRVEKCRDGSTGLVPLIFKKEFTRFESAEKIHHESVPARKPYKA